MLAVTGGKGGVGKTTTALGVARALARRGESVLAVDADRDLPDLARTVGLDAERTTATELGARPGDAPPRWADVRILTAPRERATAEDLFAALGARSERVVVDCPAGAGTAAATPLRFADRSLVVTTPAPASLRDAAKTVAMARTLDAPAAATVLSGCESGATDVERLLPTPVVPFPSVREPLQSRRILSRFSDLSEDAIIRNG